MSSKKKVVFPKKLKIFETVYRIKYNNGLLLWPVSKTHKKEMWVEGWTDFDTCTIHINKKLPYTEVWNTIWHEVGHVVTYNMRSPFTEKQEETIMNLFAIGCNTVIFDNRLKFDFSKILKL
jgi:hypothetical protein